MSEHSRSLEPGLLWRARLRLAALSLLVMGMILYAAGLAMGRLLLQIQEAAIQRELQTLAGTLHDSLKPALPPAAQPSSSLVAVLPGLCVVGEPCSAPAGLIQPHAVSASDPERFQLRLLDRHGGLVASSPGAQPAASTSASASKAEPVQPGPQLQRDRSGARWATYTIHLHHSHAPGEPTWGYLQIASSLAGLDAEAERLWWLGHGVFALAMLGMAAASWWLAGLAMAPLLEAYRRQQQFSADVAHELRTPLANLLAVVEAEHNGPPPGTLAGSSLDRVLVQGRRLQRLIADLLLLASLERPCPQSLKAVCDLAEITADVVEDFGEAATAAGVTLQQASHAPGARVLGIASELSRLVINLLSNAIQHSPAGGTVRLELEQRGSEISLRIRDSGPGIPALEQARIFDRFTRVDPARSRQQGGTGLGLAIAQAIARRHGGLITVRSTPGEGSTFSVQLPAAGQRRPASARACP